MRWRTVRGGAYALCVMGCAGSTLTWAAPTIDLQRDGALTMAGRTLRCGSVRNVLDPRLPNLGLAARGVVVFNPRLLGRQTDTVRLFVFHHECGHLHVGQSELEADCWAIGRGVREGWLDRTGLRAVCRSFDGMPETATHPSAKRRCRNLDRCFASSVAALAKARVADASATAPPGESAEPTPRLVSGPTLVATGAERRSGK